MAANTKIEWAHHTFNPWIGCSKVSPGCKHCYAEVQNRRFKKAEWGPNGTRVRTSKVMWDEPPRWNRKAVKAEGETPRVFCASLADVFEPRAELKPWRHDLFDLIFKTQSLNWLLLTKRPQHARELIYEALECDIPDLPGPHILECEPFGEIFPNVWIGTSVENEATAAERIPELLSIPDVTVRFLSVEPLLEEIDLFHWLQSTDTRPAVDWVIIGGESGSGGRPCNVKWIRSIVAQCLKAGVPCFVKQLGVKPIDDDPEGSRCPQMTRIYERRIKLNDSKGSDPDEWPLDLRVRQVPQGIEAAR